jgi:hypothetical protein
VDPALVLALPRQRQAKAARCGAEVALVGPVDEGAELLVVAQALVEGRERRGALVGARRVGLVVAIPGRDEAAGAADGRGGPQIAGELVEARAELGALVVGEARDLPRGARRCGSRGRR